MNKNKNTPEQIAKTLTEEHLSGLESDVEDLVLQANGDHDIINKNNKPSKTKIKNMAFNPDKNPGIQPQDVPHSGSGSKNDGSQGEKYDPKTDSWTDEEKAEFDKEWQEKENKKSAKKNEDAELFDDPEAAAMGGFDRGAENTKATKTTESGASNAEEDDDAQSSVSMEEADKAAEIGEEELADKIKQDEEHEEWDGEREKSRMEGLGQNLEDARRAYTSVHRKSEGMISKIKGVFGHIDTETDNDVAEMKGQYRQALENYRNAMLENIDSLPESEQKAVMEQLRSFDLKEKVSLYEDRVGAKAESMGGKFGELAYKTVQWYKKLPTKYKIAASGLLLVGGMASGTGVAAGVFGALTIGKRALGAGAAGIGMTGWTEARAHKKEEASMNKSMEKFKEMSLDEQKALLQGFDDNSFKQLEKEFHGKIAGRSRRVMYGIAAASGVMALGNVSKLFGTENIQGPGAANVIEDNASEASKVATGGAVEGSLGSKETLEWAVGDDWDSHDVHNFPDEESKQAALSGYSAAAAEAVKDSEGGFVNKELLEKEVRGAFKKVPEFSNDLPESVNIENTDFDQKVAEAQMDASGAADNPLNQGFNGIEMSGGIGALTVEPGSNIKDTIAAFLKENNYKLTEGGMGWDPDSGRWADVDEWANDRAVGLAAEYAEANPGVDINIVQPGTELKLDLSNPADVRLDVNFEGGPRIIPEGVKEAIEISDGDLYESAVTLEVVNKLGLTQEQFAQVSEVKVSDITDRAVGKNPADWTQLERALLELSRPGGVVVADKTVGEFLDVAQKSDLLQDTIGTSAEGAVEEVVTATSENMYNAEDSEAFRDRIIGGEETSKVLIKDVAEQIKEITGPSLAKQMAETKLEILLNTEPSDTESGLQNIQESMNTVIDLAKNNLGSDAAGKLVGEPRTGATMQSYLTRIFLEAERQGKVKDIFPSSNSEGYTMPELPDNF